MAQPRAKKSEEPKPFRVPLVDTIRIEPYPGDVYHILSRSDNEPVVAQITNYTLSMQLKTCPDTQEERDAVENSIRNAICKAQSWEKFERLAEFNDHLYTPKQRLLQGLYEDDSSIKSSWRSEASKAEARKQVGRVKVDWEKEPPQIVTDVLFTFDMLKGLFASGLLENNDAIIREFTRAARSEARVEPEYDPHAYSVSSMRREHLESLRDEYGVITSGSLTEVATLRMGVDRLRHAIAEGDIREADIGNAIMMLVDGVPRLEAPSTNAKGALTVPAHAPTRRAYVEWVMDELAGAGQQLVPEPQAGEVWGEVAGEDMPVTLTQLRAQIAAELKRREEEEGIPTYVTDVDAYKIGEARLLLHRRYQCRERTDAEYTQIYESHRALTKEPGGLEKWDQWVRETYGATRKSGTTILGEQNGNPDEPEESLEALMAELPKLRNYSPDPYRGYASTPGRTQSKEEVGIASGRALLGEYECPPLTSAHYLAAHWMHEGISRQVAQWKNEGCGVDEMVERRAALLYAMRAKFGDRKVVDDEGNYLPVQDRPSHLEAMQSTADTLYGVAQEKAIISRMDMMPFGTSGEMAVLRQKRRDYLGGMEFQFNDPHGYGTILYQTVNPGRSEPRPIPEAMRVRQAQMDKERDNRPAEEPQQRLAIQNSGSRPKKEGREF